MHNPAHERRLIASGYHTYLFVRALSPSRDRSRILPVTLQYPGGRRGYAALAASVDNIKKMLEHILAVDVDRQQERLRETKRQSVGSLFTTAGCFWIVWARC